MMKKFSELGVTVQDERKMFNCSQVSISDVLNCEIIVEDFIPDVKTSHGEGRYLVKFKHRYGRIFKISRIDGGIIMDIFEENCDTENNCTVSYFWKGLALFLLGVIIGLFVSPIKKGVTIGCNNKIDKGGCNDHFDPDEYYDDYDFDDDEDDFDNDGVKF